VITRLWVGMDMERYARGYKISLSERWDAVWCILYRIATTVVTNR
jgi:hypothetical protein